MYFLNKEEVYLTLNEEIFIKGVPIVESDMFKTLSDMNVPYQCISDYSNSLHNLLKKKGLADVTKKVLTIFRINPLVAVKIIESCSLVEEIETITYLIEPFIYAANDPYNIIILNKNRIPYFTLLIEAVYQQSISEVAWWKPDKFLNRAWAQDLELHKSHKREKYLNAYNIRHILMHIPENRQIEFINWFWDKHCYAAREYGKTETFSSGRVKVMMNELAEGSLWRHLENANESELSEKERKRVEKEKNEIRKFISSVFLEGRHMQYVKIVIGEDDFYEKLRVLMGVGYDFEYDSLVEKQRLIETKEKAKKRYEQYEGLVQRVKKKYEEGNELLQWHDLSDSENPQINLWAYWQGINFENVKLMILGYDWGTINYYSNRDIEKCKRKLNMLIKTGSIVSARNYSCNYKKTDYSLEELFQRCFNRDIGNQHFNDLFFSNLCLGYRTSSSIALNDEIVASDIDDFMIDELNIISPESIFCLGEKVFKLFVEGIDPDGKDFIIESEDDIKLIYRDIKIREKSVRIYSMPHCGFAGIKKIPIDRQLDYWKMARDDMKQLGITL